MYSMGLLGDAQILSLEKMVLDNHLTRRIEIAARAIPVDQIQAIVSEAERALAQE